MIKMLEIRKAIFTLVKQATQNVFYQDAPSKVESNSYPFITIDISNSTDDGTLERFTMDIDGWDADKNTTVLETMMHDVDLKLHRKTVYITDAIGGQMGVTIYRENRLTFDESDSRIFRRRYIYQIRTHEK